MTKSYNSPFEHVDYNAIIDGTKGNGIISGLTVTERGAGQNMSVDVAAGTALITWVKYTEASTVNVVITAADATHPRKDIIIYDVATTNPAVVTGTPAAEPIPPDITSGDILLAVVNVAANETTIANTDIEDGRITVENSHHVSHETGGSDEITIFGTPVEVTGSRANNTIYHNTGGAMLVMIRTSGDGTAGVKGNILSVSLDSGMAGAIVVADDRSYNVNGSVGYGSFVSAIVPAGYYYRTVVSANHTISIWTETT